MKRSLKDSRGGRRSSGSTWAASAEAAEAAAASASALTPAVSAALSEEDAEGALAEPAEGPALGALAGADRPRPPGTTAAGAV